MERRLAAILAADVVDYTRLMAEDQQRTLEVLRELRTELFEPVVGEHKGAVVKRLGDGWIVEFPSIANAVECALRIHERLAGHDIIRIRTGIHIGDVVFEEEDVFGDGVNVAARLEELAVPGEVLISDTAYQSLDGKAAAKFGDGDVHQLKNVARPMQVWRWPDTTAVDADTPPATADGYLALPDKPSIAVLPFDNMSGDPEQEFFSDGITEDIITALSRLRWLFVIARNSTFTYKGKAVDVKQVGREMGVRYVLEGSVRKAGNRIRVTAQLIEAESGNHIWAERYDRNLTDIFELQDELTAAISGQVDAELAGSERKQAHNKSSATLDAWEIYQLGMWHFYKYTKGDMAEARRLLQLASQQSPEFANAYAGLSIIAYAEVSLGYRQDIPEILQQGLQDAEKALSLDDRDGYNHFALGRICTFLGDSERAISALRRAVDLNPSYALSHYGLGSAYLWNDKAEETIPLINQAMRLSPQDPGLWAILWIRSSAHAAMTHYDLAIADAKASLQHKRDTHLPYLVLAHSYGSLGHIDEACTAINQARKLEPKLSVSYIRSMVGTMLPPYWERALDVLRSVGLPEE